MVLLLFFNVLINVCFESKENTTKSVYILTLVL